MNMQIYPLFLLVLTSIMPLFLGVNYYSIVTLNGHFFLIFALKIWDASFTQGKPNDNITSIFTDTAEESRLFTSTINIMLIYMQYVV